MLHALSFERFRNTLSRWLVFLALAFLLMLVFVGADSILEYSSDTYATFSSPLSAAPDMLFRNGRPVIALLYALILPRFSHHPAFVYMLSYWGGVLLLSASVSLLALLIEHVCQRQMRIPALLISFATCVTLFSIDFFMFLETAGFAFGIFFAVSAICLLDYSAASRRRIFLLPSLLLLILSVFSYQSTAALFVFIGLPLFIRRSQGSFKSFVALNLTAAGLYALANAANILLLQAFGSSRAVSFNLSDFRLIRLAVQYAIQYDFFLVPEHSLTWCLWGILLLCVAASLFTRRNVFICLLELVYICGIVWVHSILMMMISYDAPRVQYPLGSIFGVLLIHFLINLMPNLSPRIGRSFSVLLSIPLCALLILQFVSFQQTIFIRYKTNAWDEYQIRMIGQNIKQYEETSGETVRSIAFYGDQDVSSRYDFDTTLTSNGRAFCADWSCLTSINHYLQTNYSEAPQSEAISQIFIEQNWDVFSPDQLIFEGDTLHFCFY